MQPTGGHITVARDDSEKTWRLLSGAGLVFEGKPAFGDITTFIVTDLIHARALLDGKVTIVHFKSVP